MRINGRWVVFLVLASGGLGTWFLIEAYRTSEKEFWAVAIPGVLTGLGTIALAVVTVLAAAGERNAQAERERRSQAESIAAWTPGFLNSHHRVAGQDVSVPSEVAVHLTNSAAQPVYDVFLMLSLVQGAPQGSQWLAEEFRAATYGHFKVAAALPPGQWTVGLTWSAPPPQGVFGIEFAFTDRLGVHWQRQATGALKELKKSPGEQYGLTPPFSYCELAAGLTRETDN